MGELGKDFLNKLGGLLEQQRSDWGVFSSELYKKIQEVGNMVASFTKVQSAAEELARTVGLSSKSIMAVSQGMVEQNRRMQLSMQYNIATADMVKMQTSLMSKLGRNVMAEYTGFGEDNVDSAVENLVAARKIFGEEALGDIVAGFDKLGISMKTAAKATGKLYQEAGEYGISLQKYASNFIGNLQMAQTYNFRNGVNGLKEMARKSAEIRQDMKQIAAFADKVGTVTGAVETAAQLQVLGGSFASLSNPLAMLNESLTNIEGLQDRFNQMTMTAATYNQTTHQIEMDPWTRQQIKRAAEVMGVDATNMIDQAYAQARRGEIERQAKGIGNLSDDFAKLIVNAGEIDEYGRAGITNANGEFKTIADIAAMKPEEQKKFQDELVAQNKSESEDIKDIAKNVQSLNDKISGRREQIENEVAYNQIRPGVIDGLSTMDAVTKALVEKFNADVIQGISNIEHPFKNLENVARATFEGSVARMAEAFTAKSPEEFAKILDKVLKEELGDSKFSGMLRDVLNPAAEALTGFFKNIADWTNNTAGVNMLVFTDTAKGKDAGRAGGAKYTPTVTPSYSMEANDVVLQAQRFSLTSGENGTATANNDSLAGLSREIGESIKNAIIEISETRNTMPQQVVSESLGVVNGRLSAQNNPETRDFNYNINLSGNLMMQVNGDNGKIGDVNLQDMIKNTPGLMEEITKAITRCFERMDAGGQIHNQ